MKTGVLGSEVIACRGGVGGAVDVELGPVTYWFAITGGTGICSGGGSWSS